MEFTDTIAAIATANARGGIGVIRISGSKALGIAATFLGKNPTPRYAHLTRFSDLDGTLLDEGLVLYFKAPHSYTGEDVVELQVHGGVHILDALLERVLQFDDVRQARAGEFSERAFLNDRLDLTQAEAVADLIDAGSRQAAKAASRSLTGAFSDKVNALLEQLIAIRVQVEVRIDFSDEDLTSHPLDQIITSLKDWQETLTSLIRQTSHGVRLREGLKVVIAGRPNAGKSSLLNALLGLDAAIVSDEAGTTRDVIRERLNLAGVPIDIADTAGLRQGVERIEAEGIRRAHAEIQEADVVLYVVDSTDIHAMTEAANEVKTLAVPAIQVINKIDAIHEQPPIEQDSPTTNAQVWVSAKTGTGLDRLRTTILELTHSQQTDASVFSARRRHLKALQRAHAAVAAATERAIHGGEIEMVAEELRHAQHALSEITGAFLSDDLLGKIFGEFCIGK